MLTHLIWPFPIVSRVENYNVSAGKTPAVFKCENNLWYNYFTELKNYNALVIKKTFNPLLHKLLLDVEYITKYK